MEKVSPGGDVERFIYGVLSKEVTRTTCVTVIPDRAKVQVWRGRHAAHLRLGGRPRRAGLESQSQGSGRRPRKAREYSARKNRRRTVRFGRGEYVGLLYHEPDTRE